MGNFFDSVLTLGKVALQSRPAGKSVRSERGGSLVVMGNGPSLRKVLEENLSLLKAADTTAVNFAANTEEFFAVRPRHYILADPHFFRVPSSDPNVERLWENLRKADWDLTLHLPVGERPVLPANMRLQHFNMTPGEGLPSLRHFLFRKGLAMPRPRNVLIPALMEGIRDGYSEIHIVGADHTWPHSLYVDDSNRVVTIQPHFYRDNQKELDRVAREYEGIRIHDVLQSMVIAFRSYHFVERFAESRGVKIFNSTPGSLIDAFPRKKLIEANFVK